MQPNLVQLLANRLHWQRPSVDPDEGVDDNAFLVQKGVLEKHRKDLIFCDCGECDEPSEIHYQNGEIFYYCLTYVQKVTMSEREATLYRLNMKNLVTYLSKCCECNEVSQLRGEVWGLGESAIPLGRCYRKIYFIPKLTETEVMTVRDLVFRDKSSLLIVGSTQPIPTNIDPLQDRRIFPLCKVITETEQGWTFDVEFINRKFVSEKTVRSKKKSSRDEVAHSITEMLEAFLRRVVGVWRSEGYKQAKDIRDLLNMTYVAKTADVPYHTCNRIIRDKEPLKNWEYKDIGRLWELLHDENELRRIVYNED